MSHLNIEAITAAAKAGNAGCAYTLGVIFAREGKYECALEWLHKAAETHLSAQLTLGIMHAEGRGVPQNYGEAKRWFRASGKYNAYAQYNMGVMYAKGLGVPKSKPKAIKWFKRAASQNHLQARTTLERLAS